MISSKLDVWQFFYKFLLAISYQYLFKFSIVYDV